MCSVGLTTLCVQLVPTVVINIVDALQQHTFKCMFIHVNWYYYTKLSRLRRCTSMFIDSVFRNILLYRIIFPVTLTVTLTGPPPHRRRAVAERREACRPHPPIAAPEGEERVVCVPPARTATSEGWERIGHASVAYKPRSHVLRFPGCQGRKRDQSCFC